MKNFHGKKNNGLKKIWMLIKKCKKEQERSIMMEKIANENHKKIRMLNNGDKNLDEILSMGIVGSQHRGLGYQHGGSAISKACGNSINFVKSKMSHEVECSKLEPKAHKRKSAHDNALVLQKKNEVQKIWTKSKRGRRVYECFHYGKTCHTRSFCYKFKDSVRHLWKSRK